MTEELTSPSPRLSIALAGYVRHWLGDVWSEYERIKLTDIVGSTKLGASRDEK